jgi:hypothetical protein
VGLEVGPCEFVCWANFPCLALAVVETAIEHVGEGGADKVRIGDRLIRIGSQFLHIFKVADEVFHAAGWVPRIVKPEAVCTGLYAIHHHETSFSMAAYCTTSTLLICCKGLLTVARCSCLEHSTTLLVVEMMCSRSCIATSSLFVIVRYLTPWEGVGVRELFVVVNFSLRCSVRFVLVVHDSEGPQQNDRWRGTKFSFMVHVPYQRYGCLHRTRLVTVDQVEQRRFLNRTVN